VEIAMPSKFVRYDLKGRAALVTGGASGIGLGTATMLAKAGAKVAINYLPGDSRGLDAIAKLKAQGLDVIGAPARVGPARETETMVKAAVEELGRLDLLFNNAGTPGVTRTVPIAEIDRVTDDLWRTVVETNLLGAFHCAKAAAPALKATSGSIVSTASIAAFRGTGSSMAYAATKAGIVNLTMSLARSLAPAVRVNAIAPGAVDSPWLEWTPEQRRQQVEHSLLKKISAPEDLGDVVLFLAFGNEMITGQTIIVDAGLAL
jgi:3-oxoacyl-[acyl-carrier protein] reductase